MAGIQNVYQWAAHLDRSGMIPKEFWGETGIGQYLAQTDKQKTAMTLNTTGAYNKIYGQELVHQVVFGDAIFSILPKVPYERSGHRVVEAKGMTGVGQSLGGTLQTAAHDTFSQELYTTPALQTNTVDVNPEYELLGGKDDMIMVDAIIRQGMDQFRDGMDYALGLDTDTLASAGTYLESIDRMINSTALAVTEFGYTAADEDFMAVDRSSNTWFASPYSSDGAAGDRTFQLDFVEDMLADTDPYVNNGTEPRVILTEADTAWRINQSAGPAIFHVKEDFSLGLNGLSTQKGTAYNIRTNSLHGIPLFVAKENLTQDTITRVYIYNQDYCGIKMLEPPQTYESSDPVVVGTHLHRFVNRFHGQLYSTASVPHATIWGLK